jgi:hypothetical protein
MRSLGAAEEEFLFFVLLLLSSNHPEKRMGCVFIHPHPGQ